MDIARLGLIVDSTQVAKATNDLNRLTPAAGRAEKAARGFGAGGAFAAAAFRALLPLLSVGTFIRFSDAATRVSNSLKVAGLQGDALTRVYDGLFDAAQKNAAPLEALTQLYSRASLVQKELGISTQELIGFTEKVAVALRVSGQSASESSGALLQLSQALGSGVVRAEEFNSILEGALPIAQAAAAGLIEAGGSVAKLRQLVVDGKVSSEAFFRAFEAGSVTLDDKVASATSTVAQGFVRLQNVLIDTVGGFNEGTGAAAGMANALANVATAIETIGNLVGKLQPIVDLLNKIPTSALMGAGPLGQLAGGIRILTSAPDGAAGATSTSMSDRFAGAGAFSVQAVSLADYAVKLTDATKATRDLAGASAQASSQVDDLRSTIEYSVGSFLPNLISDLREGKDLWTAFGGAAVNALDSIASALLQSASTNVFQSIFGSATTGGLFDLLKGFGFANGAAFNNGRVMAFANGGVVDRPTLFPMANGAGLMGEAGPEAVMPLRRGPDGKLGVAAQGVAGSKLSVADGEQGVAGGDTYNFNIDARGAERGVGMEIEAAIDRAIDRNNKFVIPRMIQYRKNKSILETGGRH